MGKKTKRRAKGTGSIYLRGNIRWIAYYNGSKQIKENLGHKNFITKGMAEQALKARLGEIVQGRFDLEKSYETPYLFDIIKRYLEYANQNHKAPKRAERACKQFKIFFKNVLLTDITPAKIESYKTKRLKDGVKKATINRELKVLSPFFNYAIDHELFHSTNPVEKVKLFKLEKTPFRVVSEFEYMKFYDHAALHLKPIIKCAYYTGMRKAEILNLKWKDVDVLEGILLVRASKNYDYRQIPINESLKEMFLSLEHCSDYVFTYEKRPMREFKTAFSTALKRSGVESFRFHDLRHTFASNLARQDGVSLLTVMEILGHGSLDITKQYAHPSPEDKIKAVNSIVIRKPEIEPIIEPDFPLTH